MHPACDSFAYARFSGGKPLEYGLEEQGLWERVYGVPEVREPDIIFGLSYITPEESSPEFAAFKERRLAQGAHFPYLRARDAAFAIAAQFKLPGFIDVLEYDGAEDREGRLRLLPFEVPVSFQRQLAVLFWETLGQVGSNGSARVR